MLAYRVLGREEDARDVCQEAFLRAFRALKGFRAQAKFSSWLYRITLNLCRDWIRRERRNPLNQSTEVIDLVDGAAGDSAPESIEALTFNCDLNRVILKAISELSAEQRTAVILKEYQGLTFQEIADILDCLLSTVKTRLYQGLIVLRRCLERSGVNSTSTASRNER